MTTFMWLMIPLVILSMRAEKSMAPFLPVRSCTDRPSSYDVPGLRLATGLLRTYRLGPGRRVFTTTTPRCTLREQDPTRPLSLLVTLQLLVSCVTCLVCMLVGMLQTLVTKCRHLWLCRCSRRLGALLIKYRWCPVLMGLPVMLTLLTPTAFSAGVSMFMSTPSAADPFVLPGFKTLKTLLLCILRERLSIEKAPFLLQDPEMRLTRTMTVFNCAKLNQSQSVHLI